MTKIIVSGLVQGVGFRYYVLKHALNLSLCGTVRSRNDGKVEVNIDFENINTNIKTEFIKKIQSGSDYSVVDAFEIFDFNSDESYETFTICS